MPEDKASDGFDAGRLAQEVMHVSLGHPSLESWPARLGRALVDRGSWTGRFARLVRAAGSVIAELACPAQALGPVGSLPIGDELGRLCDGWQGALRGRRDEAPVPA